MQHMARIWNDPTGWTVTIGGAVIWTRYNADYSDNGAPTWPDGSALDEAEDLGTSRVKLCPPPEPKLRPFSKRERDERDGAYYGAFVVGDFSRHEGQVVYIEFRPVRQWPVQHAGTLAP